MKVIPDINIMNAQNYITLEINNPLEMKIIYYYMILSLVMVQEHFGAK